MLKLPGMLHAELSSASRLYSYRVRLIRRIIQAVRIKAGWGTLRLMGRLIRRSNVTVTGAGELW
jgi:hypothetical protein